VVGHAKLVAGRARRGIDAREGDLRTIRRPGEIRDHERRLGDHARLAASEPADEELATPCSRIRDAVTGQDGAGRCDPQFLDTRGGRRDRGEPRPTEVRRPFADEDDAPGELARRARSRGADGERGADHRNDRATTHEYDGSARLLGADEA
jgi:hypothetical protein